MIAEIRLYIEGGGDHKDTKIRLRKGFGAFLGEIRDKARSKRMGWHIKACGGRNETYDDFTLALKSNPDAFNVLLVDAEEAVVAAGPWEHLRGRQADQWVNPGAEDRHCHLMVQTMEAWLIADLESLAGYYGDRFQKNAIPPTANVEQIAKRTLEVSLENATRRTQKGQYHKTLHAPDILERIRPSVVRAKAPYCDRLLRTLTDHMETAGRDRQS